MSHRGGREGGFERGGRGRRTPSGAVARPQPNAPPSPQLKSISRPLLSEAFLRLPRVGEIQFAACERDDVVSVSHSGRGIVCASDARRCAILDGIKFIICEIPATVCACDAAARS
jgi:hypothetical protein